ncbi:MAG: hypothetical protein ABFD10_13295 [Prolixibacteraceae bacterium]
MKKILFLFFFVTFIVFLGGCSYFPKDANQTLEEVQNNILKVGLSGYDPDADVSPEPVNGQIGFVRQFAREINAKILWVKGSQGDITELLRHHELHMAIGGYTPDSPFKQEVTLSKPYFTEKIRIAGRGRTVPDRIKNEQVIVTDYLIAMYVRKLGAIPVMSSDSVVPGNILIAAGENELNRIGVPQNGRILHKLEYVVAVPMGENAFLTTLEKFIDQYGK